MLTAPRVAAVCAVGFVGSSLSGCGGSGGGGSGGETSGTTSTAAPHSQTTTTSTVTYAPETSVWAWRRDLDMGTQITYDLSGNMQHSLYGGCWKPPTEADEGKVETVGENNTDDNKTFAEYRGEVGLSLYNWRKDPSLFGCLMRKSRVPIDLSKISRIEADVRVTGQGNLPNRAPWYALWLAPMNYSVPDASAKAAEIDLIENYNYLHRGEDWSDVNSNFASCDPKVPNTGYVVGYCSPSKWPEVATSINHHITLTASETETEGRVIQVRRCPRQGNSTVVETCTSEPHSEIKVTKPNPTVPDWFPIWNRTAVGSNYGKYWLVADIWWTSDTDFGFHIDNLQFFNEDGSEWRIPLDYGPGPLSAIDPVEEFV